MELNEFLNKETPNEGGCMLCLAKYYEKEYDEKKHDFVPVLSEDYMLVEKHKCSNGFIFTINKRASYDYDFAWNKEMPWEILYKKEI